LFLTWMFQRHLYKNFMFRCRRQIRLRRTYGFLVRLKSGSFDIKNALTLEEIKETAEKGNPEEILTSIDKVLAIMIKFILMKRIKRDFERGFVTLGKYGKFALTQKSEYMIRTVLFWLWGKRFEQK